MKLVSILLNILSKNDRKRSLRENIFGTNYGRNCLILYMVEPFISDKNALVHQNFVQNIELANIVRCKEFNVDVANYTFTSSVTPKKYDLIIDIHPQHRELYQKNINKNAIIIGYLTGSNPTFSNSAEQSRLRELYLRKGALLTARRQVPCFKKEILSGLDAVLFIGNTYNLSSYAEFELPRIYMIRNNGHDFGQVPRRGKQAVKKFVFLASSGQVHKGLDLLLEVFSKHTDLTLYVMSLFKAEEDFCKLYHKELYETPNIIPVGFQNINGELFKNIVSECAYIILPSCSEANAGSILTGMSTGLIPIVSRECGFEADEVHYLDSCSLVDIEKALTMFSNKSQEWLDAESLKASQIVRARYTIDDYKLSVNTALEKIISNTPIQLNETAKLL